MTNKAPKLPAIACIRKMFGERHTWCGRIAYENEYLLEDAAYAVKLYNAKGVCVRACEHCYACVAPVVFGGQYESPPATRGLKSR